MMARSGRLLVTGRAEEDAAAWFARSQSGVMPPDEIEALSAWLQDDLGNRQAFEDVAQVWSAIEPARRAPTIMAARERARRSIQRRSLLKLAAPLAAAGVVAVIGIGLFQVAPGSPVLYGTHVGQTSTVGLPDGSKVVLDTDSAIRFWPRMRGERRIELVRGRAHFEVAKDHARPFVVRTDRGSVTAVGTAFDVRLQADGMKVVLVEGRVRVDPDAAKGRGKPVMLKAGDQVVATGGTWRLSRADTRVETSWLKGDLVFNEQPLRVVVEELNRYSAKKIYIADAAVGERRLSAVLKAGDAVTFINAVQKMKLAKVRTDGVDAVTLVAP
jgi:transmembrane sensor